MNRSAGLLIVLLGLGVVIVGALVWAGAFQWFGRLPGDVRIEGDNVRFYLPITSMIIVSVVLTVIANLLARWW